MIKQPKNGDTIDLSSLRCWLIHFDQSTHGKFLVFGNKQDALNAAKQIEKAEFPMYPYSPKIKEMTEKMR